MNQTKISNKVTGAFALIDNLVRNGTEYIFGYPGGAILSIYNELYFWESTQIIQHILTRHEQGAIHAADSYSRVTGSVGVCFATSGPGATNLITGIANANLDSIPIIIITGQVTSNLIGSDSFQETDIFGITFPIVKHSYRIDNAADICNIIPEAFYIAQNGRPGTIIIDIPKDIGLNEFSSYYIVRQKDIVNLQGYRFDYRVKRKLLQVLLEAIIISDRPLFYVGGGLITSDAYYELNYISDRFGIPVTTTLMGKSCFDETDPLALGMLGMHGRAYANFAVSECDLLLAIGARFDDRVTGKLEGFASSAKIIHIDIDPAEISKNKKVDIYLIGDVKTILNELIKMYRRRDNAYKLQPNRESWLFKNDLWKNSYPLTIPKFYRKLSPQSVINAIGEIYSNAIVTTDVGQHQMWSAQFIKRYPRQWSTSAGLGTMGYGLPAAIGAQIAFPNSNVVCITGDSSIQICVQGLATIAQYKLPIRVMIINNHWKGTVRQWQESFHESRYYNSNMNKGQPNFVALASSYNIKGILVETEEQLKVELKNYQNYPNPILFDFNVIENEICYPMVTPGKANLVMQGIKYKQNEFELLKKYIEPNDPFLAQYFDIRESEITKKAKIGPFTTNLISNLDQLSFIKANNRKIQILVQSVNKVMKTLEKTNSKRLKKTIINNMTLEK
jgi:acetolactate synthase I/II/III large subunit